MGECILGKRKPKEIKFFKIKYLINNRTRLVLIELT
jgi:hypothetical protein